jgi:hypothetical protein
MSTKRIYDLAVVVGSYTDRTGQQKNRYQNVGVILQKDDGGKFIMMDRSFNPAGTPYDASRGNTILISMFEPKPQEGQGGQQATHSAGQQETDDIPF